MAIVEKLKWKRGARFSGKDLLQDVDAELTEIAPTLGEVTADQVLRQAKKKSSAMHGLFEWNDKAAAEAHRMSQARDLLRSIEISILDTDTGKEVRVRKYVSVRVGREDTEGKYYTIERAIMDKGLRAQLVNAYLRELEHLQQRYSALLEIIPIYSAIERARRKHKQRTVGNEGRQCRKKQKRRPPRSPQRRTSRSRAR
jgi:hypothetical protein